MHTAHSASELGQEQIPATEAVDIARILALNEEVLDTKSRPVLRGQHPKGHGCVRAEFVVEPDLPEDLARGVFKSPRTYPALIRFSNGAGQDDRQGDAHGMAIKLLEVEGPKLIGNDPGASTQDFILVDNPFFFIKDAAQYATFSAAFVRSHKSSPIGLLIGLLFGYFWRHIHELLLLLEFRGHTPGNPLSTRYWSTTPYKLGEVAVKYSAYPHASAAKHGPVATPNGLREAMVETLSNHEARFDFIVQRQADAHSTPIEDPTVVWDERVAPTIKLATLRIPAQSFTSPEQMSACEALSFNVWRCLAEHRPLGAINRIRRQVYESISKRRHELNGELLREPTRDWAEALWPYKVAQSAEIS
jgi:catalase